jgi:RHS repeat-associated protein
LGASISSPKLFGSVEVVSKSNSSVITTRRNLPAAIELRCSNGTREISYLHKDHLGSIDTISDANGDIKQKLYFDAWGKKQVINTGNYAANLGSFSTITLAQLLDITPRGFTGHESVDHADIIHMNGRIYDPTLGRFLQADPFIQAPKNSQSYNRYAYVLNNPLSYTDPSGYNFIKKYWRVIVAAVVTYVTAGAAGGWAASWGFGAVGTMGNAIAAGAMTGFIGGAVATGSLKGALTGAFTGAVFGAIGGQIHGAEGTSSAWSTGEQMFAHASAGGVLSVVQGGKFGHGFITD